MEKRKLYFAYGMNTNWREMSVRCPKADYVGKAELKGYELRFRQVADIEESTGSVFGAVWSITKDCEDALDILEGFPNFYGKIHKKAIFGMGREEDMMMYKMNVESAERLPTIYYWNMLKEGYRENQISINQLNDACDSAFTSDNLLSF